VVVPTLATETSLLWGCPWGLCPPLLSLLPHFLFCAGEVQAFYEDLSGRQYVNEVFNFSVDKLYDLLFTSSPFLRDFMEQRRFSGLICQAGPSLTVYPFPPLCISLFSFLFSPLFPCNFLLQAPYGPEPSSCPYMVPELLWNSLAFSVPSTAACHMPPVQ
jgi:hypothetical protein